MTKLHLGCNSIILPGYVNYDLEPGPGGIVQDLTKPLPHADNTVEFIFSEHFLEHITRPQALGLMKECFRVLQPGGVCRVTVPGLEYLIDDYNKKYRDRYGDMLKMDTACQMLNNNMRNWHHQFIYDTEDLTLLFNQAGFTQVRIAEHGQHEIRKWTCEICVEGVK